MAEPISKKCSLCRNHRKLETLHWHVYTGEESVFLPSSTHLGNSISFGMLLKTISCCRKLQNGHLKLPSWLQTILVLCIFLVIPFISFHFHFISQNVPQDTCRVNRSSDRSCTKGMFHNKMHLNSSGCPRPNIALQVQNRGLKSFIHLKESVDLACTSSCMQAMNCMLILFQQIKRERERKRE